MMCRLRALFADGEISVIYTAVIHLLEATIVHDEDGGLWSGGDVSHSDKRLFRINYCVALNGKLTLVFARDFHRVRRIRKHPPKRDMARAEFLLQARDLGCIAVRDRTVARGEEERDDKVSRDASA